MLRAGLFIAILSTWACARPPDRPPQLAPTPQSVTQENPGGDADDPLNAALGRLLQRPWGLKTDKYGSLFARMPDARNWRRVRFWGYPTRAGFRYGDDHYAIALLSYTDADAEAGDDPTSCIEHFVAEAARTADGFDLKLEPLEREMSSHHHGVEMMPPFTSAVGSRDAGPSGSRPSLRRPAGVRQQGRRWLRPPDGDMPIVRGAGRFETLLNHQQYVGALVAYRSWPGTCLLQGLVVQVSTDRALAEQVVERWLRDGAPHLRWRRSLQSAPPREDR